MRKFTLNEIKKMMKQYILFLFAAIFFYNNSFAQEFKSMRDQGAFQKKMHAVASKTNTLQSNFVQIKHLDILSEDIESNGKLYFKKDNNLRWEYTEPLEYLIVLRNSKVYIRDEGKVSSYDLSGNKTFQKINEMIIRSIQGDLMIDETEYKYEFKESSNLYLVELFPIQKNVQEFMKSIRVCFSKNDFSVQRIKMIEQSGDYTLMTFKNQKVNESISDKVFIIN